jgi:hypothetical protein
MAAILLPEEEKKKGQVKAGQSTDITELLN